MCASGTSRSHLFDEGEDVLHRALERFLVHSMFSHRQVTDDYNFESGVTFSQSTRGHILRRTIWKIVVNGVVFGGEFGEEQLGKVGDSRIFVFQTLCHLSKLAFNLDHSVQNQMR